MLCGYAMFHVWVDILCGKIHRIVSLGGWLAAEAMILQTLCYAMLCYAMLCYAMLCYAMFRWLMAGCAGCSGATFVISERSQVFWAPYGLGAGLSSGARPEMYYERRTGVL